MSIKNSKVFDGKLECKYCHKRVTIEEVFDHDCTNKFTDNTYHRYVQSVATFYFQQGFILGLKQKDKIYESIASSMLKRSNQQNETC